jgi:hypothetical protein
LAVADNAVNARYSPPGECRDVALAGSSRASSSRAMQRASSLRAVSCRTTTSLEPSCSITQRQRLGAPGLWEQFEPGTVIGQFACFLSCWGYGVGRHCLDQPLLHSTCRGANVKNVLKSGLPCGIPAKNPHLSDSRAHYRAAPVTRRNYSETSARCGSFAASDSRSAPLMTG